MRRDEIRSLIRNVLPKVDKTNQYHDEFLNRVIEKVVSQMYEDIWRMNPLNLQRYTKGFGYTSPIAVNTEQGTNISYANLPESIVPFQDKSSGVRRVSTIAQGGFTFFPMDFREMDLIANGGNFNTVNRKVGYAVNQSRIEFFGMTNAIKQVGIRMDLIIPFSKYDESDEVKIPEIADVRTGETFIDRVLKILQVIRPTDLLDNNASQGQQVKDN